jgi:hypothetical protein
VIQSLTIDECLTELRELFPTSTIEVTFGLSKTGHRYVTIKTPCKERWTTNVCEETLTEAMDAKRLKDATSAK